MKTPLLAGTALLLALSGAALAQGHAGHGSAPATPAAAAPVAGAHAGHGATAAPAANAATAAFQAANARMHKDMDIAYTGDTDVDFARGMIPHHQGAVEMARIMLQHGKDPALKKLAQEIVASQEKEIAFLRDWLKKKGH